MTKSKSAVVAVYRTFHAMVAAGLLAAAAQGQTITKCQDADGNWHYGDFAAEACAQDSKITEIDERGLKVKETDAPPTEEELEAQKAAEEQQRLEADRQARQEADEQRLLRTYDNAQSIIDARDERLSALERDLESYRLFRQDLVEERSSLQNNNGNAGRINDLEQQIRQYDNAIESLQEERGEIIEEFNVDLERYRELTSELEQ